MTEQTRPAAAETAKTIALMRISESVTLTGPALAGVLAELDRLHTLACVPSRDVDGTEWGAKWTDGGYCPSVPPRSEEFARQHARNFGTRPICREVGPWVYADTGEPVFDLPATPSTGTTPGGDR